MKPWSRGREEHQPLPLRPQANHRNGHFRKESKQRETTDYSYCVNRLECAAVGIFVPLVTNMGKTVDNELSGWHFKIVCSGSYLQVPKHSGLGPEGTAVLHAWTQLPRKSREERGPPQPGAAVAVDRRLPTVFQGAWFSCPCCPLTHGQCGNERNPPRAEVSPGLCYLLEGERKGRNLEFIFV